MKIPRRPHHASAAADGLGMTNPKDLAGSAEGEPFQGFAASAFFCKL
jgi:hypothetical protein